MSQLLLQLDLKKTRDAKSEISGTEYPLDSPSCTTVGGNVNLNPLYCYYVLLVHCLSRSCLPTAESEQLARHVIKTQSFRIFGGPAVLKSDGSMSSDYVSLFILGKNNSYDDNNYYSYRVIDFCRLRCALVGSIIWLD